MKTALRWILENAGVGLLVILPIILCYIVYVLIIAPVDRVMSPLVFFLWSKEIPFVGFALFVTALAAFGALIRTKVGWKVLKWLTTHLTLFSLILHGARTGTIARILRSRAPDAPNIIMAPYFRKGMPWPFIILRVFKTADPEKPIISGVFIDLPLLVKGGTVSVDDIVLVNITFNEAIIFAATSGTGLESFSRTPEPIILKTYLQDERLQRFMKDIVPAL